MHKHNLLKVLSAVAILAMVFSNLQAPLAQAQGGDGLKRQVNGQSHRVSFISPSNGKFLPAAQALGTSKRPQDPGMALAKKYAHEFGLNHPEKDLSVKKRHENNGRSTVRYQQKYNDVPVMGGELIVNTDEAGDLYSINGEVSPDLALDTNPTIDAEQAKATALGAMAKWYEKTPEDFTSTEPELWIFDESLLQPSTRPVELVWRMEVRPNETAMPVRELILVNAQRGVISFHFNQVDTAWSGSKLHNAVPVRAKELLVDPVPTWYVATTGDDANDCATSLTSCATINAAIGKATAGNTVKVAVGTYTGSGNEVVLINKNINLSGGWNANFDTQIGMSTIDGQAKRRGATLLQSTVSIERFIIQNGFNDSGGGGIYSWGSLILNSVIITNNSAYNGAGLYSGSAYAGDSTTINNSTITNNSGFWGGGIYQSGHLTLNNTTVSSNSGPGAGGIYNNIGNLTLKNSTVSYNAGSGIYRNNGQIILQNSILALNTTNSRASDCYGAVGSLGYNILGNSTGCTFTATTGDLVNVDPKLGVLVGLPGYIPLLAGSPAIDAGNPATPGSDGAACLSGDQRGVIRPVGGRCDIGAYEYTVPDSAASLSIVSGNNQHAGPNIAFINPLKVAVLDSQGSPVTGVKVTFMAPDSGPSGRFTATDMGTMDSTSDTNGIVTTSPFVANALLGSFTVTASANGVAPVNFNLQNAALYVATTGNDTYDCLTPSTPCATMNTAIGKATAGDMVKVALGTYTGSGNEVVLINKNVTLSGGWDADFDT